MNITLTGSLGNINQPLAETLIRKGHRVTIISSKHERKAEIEKTGAVAAIGTMQDESFLTAAFAGADIIYLMESLGEGFFFDQNLDYRKAITEIAQNYKKAVEQSGVKKIIHLSSIGGHRKDGTGMLTFHYDVEQILKQLPGDVCIKTMRPVGFYYNLLAFIPAIKSQGRIFQNYGGDEKEPWVSPIDIAAVVAEEMETPFAGRSVRYIASDEVSPNEVASILGDTIAKPDLAWTIVSDEQFLQTLISRGMNPEIARGMMEMNVSRRNGILYEDYFRNRPKLSPTKLKQFALTFAKHYNTI